MSWWAGLRPERPFSIRRGYDRSELDTGQRTGNWLNGSFLISRPAGNNIKPSRPSAVEAYCRLNRRPLNEVSVGQPASAFGLPGEPERGSMDQLGDIFAKFQTTPDT